MTRTPTGINAMRESVTGLEAGGILANMIEHSRRESVTGLEAASFGYLTELAAAQSSIAASAVARDILGERLHLVDHQARLVREQFAAEGGRFALPFSDRDDFVRSDVFKRLLLDLDAAADDDTEFQIGPYTDLDPSSSPDAPRVTSRGVLLLVATTVGAAAVTTASRIRPEIAEIAEEFRNNQLWLLTLLVTVLVANNNRN